MERLFVGVDGGGTKTAFAAASADGVILARAHTAGSSYRQHGFDQVVARLQEGVDRCLAHAGGGREELAGLCLGLPCFGESGPGDARLSELAVREFAPARVYLCNDVEVGWAGSLGCESGINIVAGTGAIAFGRDRFGTTARSGGWSEFFGDEGSCYWVGRRAMELFSKQADHRLPRGGLYEVVRGALGLKDDFDFITVIERDFAPLRERTASFQRYAEQAALAGDGSCVALYEEAAAELALTVRAVLRRLRLGESPLVSYSGGLFRAGGLILGPFSRRMEALGCRLREPKGTPVEGAVLLALEKFK